VSRGQRTVSRLRSLVHPVLGHRRVEPAVALVLRARTVRPSWRFVARELLRRRGLALYRLRGGAASVGVRHRTGDVVTLGEVFHEHDYEPPSAVDALLGPTPRILDLGANVGMFGAFALQRWPAATIRGYEPDPDNASVHERVIAVNDAGARWSLEQAAAGATNGTARFAGGQAALSHLASDGELEVEVHDVLAAVAEADLLKIDVEGGEWAIIGDPRFADAPPRALAMEYHPEGCPAGEPRAEAERLLHAAGMRTAIVWERDRYGMLWAWRD
jgi:FkbM family methyltransferase